MSTSTLTFKGQHTLLKLEASIDRRGGAVSLHRPQVNRNASNGLPL